MNAENGKENAPDDVNADDDVDGDADLDSTIVIDDDDFESLSDTTSELNVDELVAKIDAGADTEEARKLAARRRLDELAEARKEQMDLGDTYNINLDDDDF